MTIDERLHANRGHYLSKFEVLKNDPDLTREATRRAVELPQDFTPLS
jgi:hypothetical protein